MEKDSKLSLGLCFCGRRPPTCGAPKSLRVEKLMSQHIRIMNIFRPLQCCKFLVHISDRVRAMHEFQHYFDQARSTSGIHVVVLHVGSSKFESGGHEDFLANLLSLYWDGRVLAAFCDPPSHTWSLGATTPIPEGSVVLSRVLRSHDFPWGMPSRSRKERTILHSVTFQL